MRIVLCGLSWERWSAWNDERRRGGGYFFSRVRGRSLVDEDEIVVLSVGVDIGSSTSHLVFLAHRARATGQPLRGHHPARTFYESDILLTPYSAEETIDAAGARRLHRAPIQGRQG